MCTNNCSEETTDSKVKVSEGGKQAVFKNPQRRKYVRVRVDGCLICQSRACDWMVQYRDGSVLVELKGSDVGKAYEQIAATLQYLRAHSMITDRVAALVVCRGPKRHPSFDTTLQRIKNTLSKRFHAPIHVVTANLEFEMERVLAHDGPL